MVTFRARELSFDDAPRARQRLGVWAVGLFSFAVLGSLLFPDFAPHVAGLLATAGVVAAFASRAKAGGLVSLGSGELRVGDAHVEIAPARGGARRVARADLVAGFVTEDGGGVVLGCRGGERARFAFDDGDAARAFYDALEVSPRARVVRIAVADSPHLLARFAGHALTTVVLGAAMLGLLAGGLALLFGVAMLHDGAGLAGPGVAAVLGGGGLLLLAGVAIRRNAQKLIGEEVRIGADGVTAPGAGRGRFVPYARIERVLKTPRGVLLRLRDGGVVDVPASAVDIPEEPGAGGAAMDDLRERRALLHGCIDEAFRASRASDAKWARFERLDRAGRALDVWRRDLAGVAGGEGTYRDATLSRDDLLRVAEDPAQPPLRRVGAAVALAGARDVGTAKRVRAAANACLDDDLRRALDAAAEGEVLEAELARVEGRRA